MFHAQQTQAAAPTGDVRRIESPSIIPDLHGGTRPCGLYRYFDRGATGMLNRVLHGLLRDLVHGGGDPGIELERWIDVYAQCAAETPADPRGQAVERGAESGALHGRGIQLVAVFAHLLHHGFEKPDRKST